MAIGRAKPKGQAQIAMINDVCIIGGGAAGLAAAAALDKNIKVCILEKNEILGRKIAATGGGRCNLTNDACEQKGVSLDFFASLGLETTCDEEGRYYPYSERAADVVEILTEALGSNVKIELGFRVAEVEQIIRSGEAGEGELFVIRGMQKQEEREIVARRVIMAAGGKAAPQFGTTGDGYSILKRLGHEITRLYPILTSIECEEDFSPVKGIRAKAKVSLKKDGISITEEERGEVQFTDKGLSGICIFNLTPHMKIEKGESPAEGIRRFSVKVDLAPDFTAEQIAGRRDSFGIITRRLADFVSHRRSIKELEFPVKAIGGWREAQCTAGGVPISEVNLETMESNIRKGLYIAGEILDVQGPCGGYNLQNAWETGIKAARAINENLARVCGGKDK